MRRVRSTKRNCKSVNKRYRRKNSTRRMQRGGWEFSDFYKSSSTTKTAAPASEKNPLLQKTDPAIEAPPAQGTKGNIFNMFKSRPETEAPTMGIGQRLAGFATLGTAAYVANRMEDKIDFLMQKEGLDEHRKSIDAYWKRSQKGYFDKKQQHEKAVEEEQEKTAKEEQEKAAKEEQERAAKEEQEKAAKEEQNVEPNSM